MKFVYDPFYLSIVIIVEILPPQFLEVMFTLEIVVQRIKKESKLCLATTVYSRLINPMSVHLAAGPN